MGQVLMLALAVPVPAMCLLLFLLTQVEKWLLKDDGPHMRADRNWRRGRRASPAHAGVTRRR